MAAPTVSIIVPTFNRANLLPRALDSIITQTYDDWEIVVVDDGSADDTPAVLARYAQHIGDRLIRVEQENRGSSAARNRGIDAARGRFIAFLDSDDEFAPTKLRRQMELFGSHPELGFVYSDYAYVDETGRRCESAFDTKCALARGVSYERVAPGLCLCTGSLFDSLIVGYFVATIVGMVRRELLGSTIRFPEEQSYAEEWLFYLQIARQCRSGFVDEPLCVHHFNSGSLARSDKRRNAVRYAGLLEAIRTTFPDLSRAQRRVVNRNLAEAYRQIGYDAQRDGRQCDAIRAFARSAWSAPDLSGFVALMRAISEGMLSEPRRHRHPGHPSSQAGPTAVR